MLAPTHRSARACPASVHAELRGQPAIRSSSARSSSPPEARPPPYDMSTTRASTSREAVCSKTTAPRFAQDRIALGSQAVAGGLILEGVAAHQDLGHRLDVVLVEQPDLEGRDLLRLADADQISDPDAALTQEVPGGAFDAEGIVVEIVSRGCRWCGTSPGAADPIPPAVLPALGRALRPPAPAQDPAESRGRAPAASAQLAGRCVRESGQPRPAAAPAPVSRRRPAAAIPRRRRGRTGRAGGRRGPGRNFVELDCGGEVGNGRRVDFSRVGLDPGQDRRASLSEGL